MNELSAIELRPMRPTDRERVGEISANVWGGDDYVPQVFDDWLADPGGWFQAGEVEGEVVAFHRMRPLSAEVIWFEALRVDEQMRHQGIGRAMVREAQAEALRLGFREMRLSTDGARGFFARLGFDLRLELGQLFAARIEGGEPARMPPASEALTLFERLQQDPAFGAYAGLNGDIGGARDLDAAELARLLDLGAVRTHAGGRAVAVVRPSSGGTRLRVTFLSGSGGALDELLQALRFEADADGRSGVAVLLPPDHPAADAVERAGFSVEEWKGRGGAVHFSIFSTQLR